MQSRRNPIRLTEGHTILGTEAQRAILGGALRHMEIRERKGPSQRVIPLTGSQKRIPDAPKFEDRSLEETLKQERCAPQRCVGNVKR